MLVLALTNFTPLGSGSLIVTPLAVAPRWLVTLILKVCLLPTGTTLGLTALVIWRSAAGWAASSWAWAGESRLSTMAANAAATIATPRQTMAQIEPLLLA